MSADTERMGQRRTTSTRGKAPGSARLASLTLTVGLAAGALLATASIGAVKAIGPTMSSPAGALTSGLQPAQRLTPPAPNEPAGPTLSAEVQAILDSVNAHRAASGIAPVTYHQQLTEAALAHAADQYNRNCLTTLSHTGTDGSNTGTRIARTGLSVRTWGENIACNQQSAAQVMQAWMNSDGHRANILNPAFTHIGISITRDTYGHLYWVQVFGTPR